MSCLPPILLCPTCKVKLREEPPVTETRQQRVVEEEYAPEFTYRVTRTAYRCPKCKVRQEQNDEEKSRAESLKKFWMHHVNAAGYAWPDVKRLREMVQKICDETEIEKRWLLDWLANGG